MDVIHPSTATTKLFIQIATASYSLTPQLVGVRWWVHNSAVSECERDLLLLLRSNNNNNEINTGYGRRQASSCLGATSFFSPYAAPGSRLQRWMLWLSLACCCCCFFLLLLRVFPLQQLKVFCLQ